MGHPQIRLVGNTSKKNRSSQEKSAQKTWVNLNGEEWQRVYIHRRRESCQCGPFSTIQVTIVTEAFCKSSCLRKISLQCPEREAAWCHGSIAAEDGWIPARTASCSMLSTQCYNVDSQSVWELKRAPNVKTLANHTKHWLQALKLLHISFKSEECSSNQELLEGKTFHTAVPPSVFKLSWLMLLKLSLFTRYLWFLYFLSKIRL